MGGKSTTSTQTVSIPPEVMARYNAVNARAEDVAATPFQPYSGEFVAPLTPTQQAGIQNTSQYSQAAQPYYGAATGLTMAGAAPVNPQNLQIGRYMSPYTGYVAGSTEAALRQQQGQQLSQQQTDAIRAGAFGGDRAGIQRAALQGQQSLATAQALAPIYQQGYSQALGAAQQQQGVNLAAQQANRQAIQQTGQQLAGLGTGAQAAALSGAQAQLQAGGVEQQTKQALDTAQYQQFLQQRGYPFQVAQFLANIAMGTGALSGSTTTTEQPSGLFSDERLKHDAERVGYTDDGLPIYTYKYNGDNKTQMGVMAQDVEKKHPDAVGQAQASDGHMYKTVDYGKLDAKERAYGGGLDVNSMGGAVMEPGAFARGGYLGGGLVGDTEMKSMMANMKQPLGMYQQAGLYGSTPYQTPYGPGLGIRGDAVPVPSLVTAGSLKSPPPSALDQATSAYKKMQGLGEMGSGIYDFGERVAVGRPEIKDDKGKITQEKSSGLVGTAGKYDPKKGWFGSKDIPVEATGQAYPVDVSKASGGLVGRSHYEMGGDLPYAAGQQGYDPMAEVVKQGQQQHPSLPKPGQLPKPPEPLKDAMQTGMQLYSAGKMGSAAIDKGKELIAKMGGEGGLTPIAKGSEITAMPVPRPAGLGAAPTSSTAAGTGAPAVEAGAAAPTEAVAASTPEALGAAATPAAETVAAAAPEALGAAAAPVAETAGTALAAAAPEALGTAAVGAEEALPFLLALLKRGGRVESHHYAEGGLVPRQGYATRGSAIADYSEEADLPALGAAETLSRSEPDPLLLKSESGNNWKAENEEIGSGGLKGHFGRSQFGQARLMDAIRAGAIPEGTTPEKFMASPDLQIAAEKWHYGNLNDIIDNRGLSGAIGKEINGVPVTRQGLVNVGHLGGPTGMVKFVESGGQYNPADANKKSLTDYLRLGYASESGGLGQAAASKAIDQAAGKATGLASYFPTKKDDTGTESTDWKKILIPLLTTAAGVASAPTRNWGTALAMGLGAGAQSYANLEKQQADVAYRNAETGKLTQETQLQLLDRLNSINAVRFGKGLPLIKSVEEYMRRIKDGTIYEAETNEKGAATTTTGTVTGNPVKGQNQPGAPDTAAGNTGESKLPGNVNVGEDLADIDWNKIAPSNRLPTMQHELETLQRMINAPSLSSEQYADYQKKAAELAARIDALSKQDYLLTTDGQKIVPKSWSDFKQYQENMPKITEMMNKGAEAYKGRQQARYQLENISRAFEQLKTGAFEDVKTQVKAALDAAGYPTSEEDLKSITSAQTAMKNAWDRIFARVGEIGGQVRNYEIQGLQKASPDVTLQPGSNRNLIASGVAALDYEDKYYNDMVAAKNKLGAKFDPASFSVEWQKQNKDLLRDLSNEAKKNVSLRGDTPVLSNGEINVKSLETGHNYILEANMGIPGVTKPTKVKYLGLDEQNRPRYQKVQ